MRKKVLRQSGESATEAEYTVVSGMGRGEMPLHTSDLSYSAGQSFPGVSAAVADRPINFFRLYNEWATYAHTEIANEILFIPAEREGVIVNCDAHRLIQLWSALCRVMYGTPYYTDLTVMSEYDGEKARFVLQVHAAAHRESWFETLPSLLRSLNRDAETIRGITELAARTRAGFRMTENGQYLRVSLLFEATESHAGCLRAVDPLPIAELIRATAWIDQEHQ